MKNATIIGITPFEKPDLELALSIAKTQAFPVLHLGRDKTIAAETIAKFTNKSAQPFGVCIVDESMASVVLPEQVSLVILPLGIKFEKEKGVQLIYQIHTIEEALQSKIKGADGIIVKGNEGAGKVGYESTYILFQRVIKEVTDIDVYVQGGIGVHTAAAVVALGGKGVVLDSQLILFPECAAPKALKTIIEKLSGNETSLIDHFRVLVRPNSPTLPENATANDLNIYFNGLDLEKNYLPLGQDVALSIDLVSRYRKLDRLFFAIEEAIFGHLNQAKSLNVISANNALATDLNITYPIAQGPMTRVSDVAPFANAVADAGALPFIALSLLKGEKAKQLITETKQLAGNKTWGVGILGFAPQALRDEQIEYIKEAMPPVVLIAGGRPSQAKQLEKIGIKTFLHVPSVSLLDMFLKEGAKKFVFEGRECGGHVGPLSSFVLWERQIERLLKEEDPESISVFFAGGIHDAFSTAIISVMAAPLAAKGVKIGVLMGTSYLYTKEVVTTGAILGKFQEQAVSATETILLETAPGHETRCLKSPFVDHFNETKQQLQAAGNDKKQIWEKLEGLNVGKLRVAAKGIERRDNNLVAIDEYEQLSTGMYMIGQVAAMCNTIMSIEDLHKNVAVDNYQFIQNAQPRIQAENNKNSLEIAIVGMACIFPGSKNLDEFWRNIVLGKDSVTEVPDERWNKALYYDPTSTASDMSHSKWGGFIPKIDFDPLEYGIPPQSLAAIEPTQLLTLMVAKQALENAGYKDGNFDAENVSVIIGAEGGNDLANNYSFRCYFKQVFGEIPQELEDALPTMTEDSFPGILANVIAGRITNRLNLGGRNFTVDAACASSLAAIDLACQELFLEKSDMVLAGGADLHNGINDYLMFSSTHALSKKGRCATFDGSADGIALGEGIAMVVLKRKEDAVRDGNKIYSVIKGIGGSSDGKSLGLTAPRKSGQIKALERAYEQAGISPSVLGLVEAHGTGTVVGDRTELSAFTDMMNQSGAVANQTHLGSVKTQIGHTKCAAGLAGLIKASLSAYYGVKPATIHLQHPNSYYKADKSPFVFNAEAGLWMDEKRYAGISAFGFGGTNFHAVIENDRTVADDEMVLKSWPSELFVFRGDDYEESKTGLTTIKMLLADNDSIAIKDIAFSLATINQKPIQLTIIADSAFDLVMKIDLVLSGVESRDTYITNKKEGKIAFMFPGQGSQRINMARELFVAFPAMRKLLKNRPEFSEILFPNAVFDDAALKNQKNKIKDTRMAQPLLGIVDIAIANLLKELGIEPDMVAGHSYGELPALCFAGAFNENELVILSKERAKAILDAVEDGDKGEMIAVNCKEEDLMKWMDGLQDVYFVNHNSPTQLVVAGKTAAIKQLSELLKSAKVSFRQLEVACAFHSPLVSRSKDFYAASLAQSSFNNLALPVWSNTTAQPYPTEAENIKLRLTEHLVKPVKFVAQVHAMYADGARIFIEVGPGKTLTTLVKACIGKDEILLHTEDNGQGKLVLLLGTLAKYLATGRSIKLEKLFEGRDCKFLDLNAPAQYKKKSTVWLVNGQHAVPSVGKLPAHGALPIINPIKMKATEIMAETAHPAGNTTELMMQEYLNTMKMMIQSQRDVMLKFLGHNVQETPMNFKQAATYVPIAQPLQTPINNVVQHQPQTIQPAQQPKQAVVHVDVKMLLMQIVSDKTGYPQDMLGMEMDLEADLSIDSIKRMEIIGGLKTALGGFANADKNEDVFMEQLAGIKTLNGLVNWITEHALPQKETSSITVEITTNGQQSTKIKFTAEEIKTAVLSVVSEKTGYPKDMLGMELDLEADLSIDSIKRMEIIGNLNELIGFNKGENGTDDLMEKLASIKTIQSLIKWIADLGSGQAEAIVETKKVAETIAQPTLKEKLSRLRFEFVASTIQKNHASELIGFRFAVIGDHGEQASAVKQLFEEDGATVKILNVDDNLTGFQGLIILNMFLSPKKPNIIQYIEMIKRIEFADMKWVYFISDTKAYMNTEADKNLLRHFQGYAGLFKTLDKEYENTKFRIVSLTTKMAATELAEIALNEILSPDQPSEIVYHGKERKTVELIPSELIAGLQDSHIKLEKEAVVLVFGGAQGITSKLMIHFAKDYPCRYILVGRSADPRLADDVQLASLETKEAIKKYLIQQGEIKKPAEIEQVASSIFKNNQILQTIAALEKDGSTVTYKSLDLRDEEELSGFIKNVYETYGRIDGVVHGAGLLEDKLFHSKSVESFKRVFDTKVIPLRVLAEQLRPETQFVIFFSSIASVYGNRGQTDYAAANSVMDRYAWELQKNINGKVLAINWGPWKGAGMVSDSLEKEYERRGVQLIPLQEGMEIFMNEMKYGNERQVLIMAGK